MICPLCQQEFLSPSDLEETWQSSRCDNCEDFEVEYWDKQIQQEKALIDIGNNHYMVIFDRAKNNTQLYKWHYHERDQSSDYTEHLLTIPSIKDIPNKTTLTEKVKIWLTFQ